METKQSVFDTPLFENLRKLITVVDELRDVGLQEYINLPRIAVVGTQSAGKSSLLESIVGMDCLPRGEGVCTRRPLEMRLVHTPVIEGQPDKPYAKFDELPGQKFEDFNIVRDKIQLLTDKEAGGKKQIINKPIIITVYSSTCPDLTIIDLPGITKIAIDDQSQDIERVTKDMCMSYARDERTIILCVIPANQDMSTSDALLMARQLDPQGKRTIGVITKIDIMDKGTNARRMLMNQEIPLKLGYVGVRNRCQQDIIDKVKVKVAIEHEAEYFNKHPVYSTLPPGMVGTKSLTQKLTTVMFHHIKNFLPQIIKEINTKIRECEDKLKDLGPPMPIEKHEKMQLLWNMITDYTENFKNAIKGKYDGKRNTKINSEVSGGAMIKSMFSDLLKDYSDQDYKATIEYKDKDIEKAIILHQGDSIPGFPSIDAFLYLIQPQLEKLKDPALDALQNVYLYLDSLSTKLIERLFNRFPSLIEEISETVGKVLNEEKEKTREIVENIIDAEQGYLFTNDYHYLLNRTSILPKVHNQDQNKPVDSNTAFIMELRARIDAYFQIVVRNVRDTVPKAIGFFLVKSVQEKMQYQLYSEIMKNVEILEQLGEPPHIAQERKTLDKILSVLKKAQTVLKKDPDLASSNLLDDNDDYMGKLKEQGEKQKQQQQQQQQQPQRIQQQVNQSFQNQSQQNRAMPNRNNDSNLFGPNVPNRAHDNSLFGPSVPNRGVQDNSLFGDSNLKKK